MVSFPTSLLRTALASLSLLLLGCQNPTEGTTLVEGQVIEPTSRQPVGGATVQVWQAGRAGGYGPVGQGQLADAQGRFSFRFEAESESDHLVMATAPPGYITDWGLAPRLTPGRRNKDLLVPTYAPAWVRLVLVDELPKSQVVININGYSGGGETIRFPRDTVLIRPVIAGFRRGLLYTINDQQTGKETITSNYYIQPTPLDTITVRIPF